MNPNSHKTPISPLLLLLSFSCLLSHSKASAFFDKVVDTAEKIAEASALVDATHELLRTVDSNPSEKTLSQLDQSLIELSAYLEKIEGKTQTAVWAKNEIEALMRAPRLSKMTLTDSIQVFERVLKKSETSVFGTGQLSKSGLGLRSGRKCLHPPGSVKNTEILTRYSDRDSHRTKASDQKI
jgi:hypothetical protein